MACISILSAVGSALRQHVLQRARIEVGCGGQRIGEGADRDVEVRSPGRGSAPLSRRGSASPTPPPCASDGVVLALELRRGELLVPVGCSLVRISCGRVASASFAGSQARTKRRSSSGSLSCSSLRADQPLRIAASANCDASAILTASGADFAIEPSNGIQVATAGTAPAMKAVTALPICWWTISMSSHGIDAVVLQARYRK